ncbi:MAG: PaaI family thioesterase [Actinobacteria bacterium]|nr:PaaI family thioesterase [Actinomycetota bacterium]
MTWLDDEPVRGGYPSIEFLALSGLERMEAAGKGLMPKPPIHHLFGLTPATLDQDTSTFVMPSSPWLQSGAGVFLPGVAALLADAPLGSAILTALGPGEIAVTSDLTLNYLRPLYPNSGQLSAHARSIDVGRRLGLAEAVVEDGSGQRIAHSTTRCFIRSFPVTRVDGPPPVEHPVYDSPDPHERPLTTGIVPAEIWATKSFIEICDLMGEGELPLPPFVKLFGLSGPVAKEGYFETTASSSPWFSSPAGTIYGGFLAFMADSVLAGAVNTVIPANSTFASLDLKVSFLRPVMPDGRPITAGATVIHRGRSLVVAEGQIVNADGKVVVRAASSAAVMEGRSWMRAVIDEAESPD